MLLLLPVSLSLVPKVAEYLTSLGEVLVQLSQVPPICLSVCVRSSFLNLARVMCVPGSAKETQNKTLKGGECLQGCNEKSLRLSSVKTCYSHMTSEFQF